MKLKYVFITNIYNFYLNLIRSLNHILYINYFPTNLEKYQKKISEIDMFELYFVLYIHYVALCHPKIYM